MDNDTKHHHSAGCCNEELIARVGHMTRVLHDSLRALGLDRVIEDATRDIPDVRARLDFVMTKTDAAAQRVLDATDKAIPLQEQIQQRCLALAAQLQAGQGSAEAGLAGELGELAGKADTTKQQLLDIMMAQDFQDITGQVIRKVIELATELETQLVQLLIDYSDPAEAAHVIEQPKEDSLMNGPQIQPNEGAVSTQSQVDDLLSSLGF